MDLIVFSLLWIFCSFTSAQTSGSVRLVNGNSQYQGRIEVYYNGVWGTVCHSYASYEKNIATVVCGMLGYTRSAASFWYNAYFGQGTGQIWLKNVQCAGHENSIGDCTHSGWGNTGCSHATDLSVICFQTVPVSSTPTSIRLVNGGSVNEGHVEVYYAETRGTVCDDSFDNNDAAVACGMLGFSSGVANVIQMLDPLDLETKWIENKNEQFHYHSFGDFFKNAYGIYIFSV